MAIRDDFTAGEVLAAADLNDTFASKPPFAYGTATPSTTVEGFIWYDENSTPPLVKFWDGSVFQTFSSARATVTATTGSPTITTRSDGKTVYKWTGDGTVTLTEGLAGLLLVAGGGSGGRKTAGAGPGGGGGGGVIGYESVALPAGTLTVTVGVGGAAQNTDNTRGNAGTNTRLGDLYTIGGGGGGEFSANVLERAGCGGGGAGSSATGTAGLGIDGQGFGGGNGVTSNTGGGGGGAGQIGAVATSGVGGKGGDGKTNNFETLASQTYGGGGGGATSGATQGAGGAGGGTAGVSSGASMAGTDGFGGGSGGSRGTGSGKGGNGVVILVIG